ncbi:conserved hypothetical protein [Burkholderia cepacia]|uniref:hypothetical protein n=1 Tax=Burkholderia cepacia TaxID=292 RepID=UPI001CB19593|nr:hypothetical protein [Burkholderia cepacia]CAG9252759.1 conserved hypothetical protein [Burkholderia cepacia]
MKESITTLLAFTTLFVGLRASLLWYRASKVEIIPETKSPWSGMIDPMDYASYIAGEESKKRVTIEKAYQQSGALNANAALWTAIAVFVGTLTTLAGIPGW